MALIVLMVAFGIQTVYSPPEEPRFPEPSPNMRFAVPPEPDIVSKAPPVLTPEEQADAKEAGAL